MTEVIDDTTRYPRILRSRFRAANIPVPYLGTYLTNISDVLDQQLPENAIENYVSLIRDGKCIRAQGQRRTCGQGLWISGTDSRLLAAALVQQLLLDQHVESAFFIDAYEYTESKKPDRDSEYETKIYSDIVVLSGVTGLSEWASNVIYHLTRERYFRGLPTVIADSQPWVSYKTLVFDGSTKPVILKENTHA
jgi:hypothetical protein